MAELPVISAEQRAEHHSWLLELTQVPTAAGREQRVIRWIERWVAARSRMALTRDSAGNLVVKSAGMSMGGMGRPVYFTAHMDHPAFVVERIIAPTAVSVSFRGGVMDDYFKDGPIVLGTADDRPLKAKLISGEDGPPPFKHYVAELETGDIGLALGDVGVWDVGPAEIIEGNMHTLACDDLAAAAAALA